MAGSFVVQGKRGEVSTTLGHPKRRIPPLGVPTQQPQMIYMIVSYH